MRTVSLKAARVDVGLSQLDAAHKLNISRTTLQNYEAYKTSPDVAMSIKMAELYKRSVNEIKWRDG